MNRDDFTLEYCPWCDNEVVIHATGITACPECGKPLAPCSVCTAENDGCHEPCPYGCDGTEADEQKTVTMPPVSEAERTLFLASF